MRTSPKSEARCGRLFIAKEAHYSYGGGAAGNLETSVLPSPRRGWFASFEDVPGGEGRDESGIDISATRNKAIREEACRRHMAALKREEAAIRNGTHPEYLRRAEIAARTNKKRAVEAEMDAKRKIQMVYKMGEYTQVLDEEDARAAIEKAEAQRLRQAEAQRLRHTITRPATGIEARRTTRATGKPLVVDTHMLHEPPKSSTRAKAPNIKIALLLRKSQVRDDIARLGEEGGKTSDPKHDSTMAAAAASATKVGNGDTETAAAYTAGRSPTLAEGDNRDGVVGGGSPARVFSSGGMRAKPRPVGSGASDRNGGRSGGVSSSGGGSVAPAHGKGNFKSAAHLFRTGQEDGYYVDGYNADGYDDGGDDDGNYENDDKDDYDDYDDYDDFDDGYDDIDGGGGQGGFLDGGGGEWGGARAGSSELDEVRGGGMKRSRNGEDKESNVGWRGARAGCGRDKRTKTR